MAAFGRLGRAFGRLGALVKRRVVGGAAPEMQFNAAANSQLLAVLDDF